MAVSIRSRYRGSPVFPAPDAHGTVRATVAIRRHAPPAAADYRHRLSGVEDLEYLAWRFLGDGERWWRIADANPIAFPLDLGPGTVLAIPTTEQPVLRSRERVF